MTALASFFEEHRIIARVIDALAAYADLLAQDGPIERSDLGQFARFFAEFADYIHHDKEETILLPLLARHGFDWNWGPLADIRREHRHERQLIGTLSQAAAQESDWSDEQRRHIANIASTVVEFQRAHMKKENSELFPDVLSRLPKSVLDELGSEVRRFDAMRPDVNRDDLIALAERLAQRYAPDRTSATAAG